LPGNCRQHFYALALAICGVIGFSRLEIYVFGIDREMNVTIRGIKAFLTYVSSKLDARHGDTHRQYYEIWLLFVVRSTDNHVPGVLQVITFIGCDTTQLNKGKSEWFQGRNTS